MTERDGARGDEHFARTSHDPHRPSLSSRQAADRIGVTSQAVIDGIRRKTIDGYYLAGPQRRRWFAYVTSVDEFRERRRPASSDQELLQRIAQMEDALVEERTVAELLLENVITLQRSAAQLTEANQTLVEGNMKLTEALQRVRSSRPSDLVPAYPPGGG